MIQTFKNLIIPGAYNKPVVLDVMYESNLVKKPVIIYVHGFKGFKDWGNFDQMAHFFVEKGFIFLKFNFSHNGMSPVNTQDFTDLDSFGNNNASKEIHDLKAVIEWMITQTDIVPEEQWTREEIMLIGHSRGGGTCIITAREVPLVKKVATCASISDFNHIWKNFTSADMERWQREGVQYTLNSRTKQQMPLYFQLYQDYQDNKQRFNLIEAVAQLSRPSLICHGTLDEAVPVESAHLLHDSAGNFSKLLLIEGADHVFNRKHPDNGNFLPAETLKLVNATAYFFTNG